MSGVSNDHLKDTCQTWNGQTYAIMALREAKKLEKEGLIQITTNLQAKDLKPASAFKAKAETIMPPGVEPAPAKKKRTYKTRQMKAD